MNNLDRSAHTTARVLYARWFKSMHFFNFPQELRDLVYSYLICDTGDLGRQNFDVPARYLPTIDESEGEDGSESEDDSETDGENSIDRIPNLPRFVVARCPRVKILLLNKRFKEELEEQIRHEGGRHLSIEEDKDFFEPEMERVRPIFTMPDYFLRFGSLEVNLKIEWYSYILAILEDSRPQLLMRL